MATSSSTWCMLALTLVLGATLFGTCMANKEIATQQWGWGRGWGRGGDRGRGWSRGGGRHWGRGSDRGWGWHRSSGAGRRWGRDWSHGGSVPPPPPPPTTPSAYNHSSGGSGCPSSDPHVTGGSNKIIVGGSNNWNFGNNYTDWALKNGPFYLNDVLVFKYNAPVNNAPGHSVYLLPDFWSYLKCDLSRAKRVASTTEGGGNGFEFKLTKWQPYYFACGEHDGIHCNLGMMKFVVMPIFRYSN